jgi:putative tricarboxylic transport membrane protein
MTKLLHWTLLACALAVPASAADYSIMAPAAPGGGWDQTARTMQAALQDEGISGNVQVTNVPGAGGTIGLAQFVNQAAGDPEQLIVGGYVMVGAILTNQSPVSLEMITPIARLTGESRRSSFRRTRPSRRWTIWWPSSRKTPARCPGAAAPPGARTTSPPD